MTSNANGMQKSTWGGTMTPNQCGLVAPFGRWTWLTPRPSHRRYGIAQFT